MYTSDNYGNTRPWTNFDTNFATDGTKPVISAFSSSLTATNSQVTFTWSATDTHISGLNHYEIYRAPYNAGNITMNTSPHGWFSWFSSRLLPGALAIVNTACTDADKTGCAWTQVATATSPYTDTISSLSDGAYYYGLHAVDNAGNVGTEPLILKVVLDTTAPGALGGEAITAKISAVTQNANAKYTGVGTTSTNANQPTFSITCASCTANTAVKNTSGVISFTPTAGTPRDLVCNDTGVTCTDITNGMTVQIPWFTGKDNNGTWKLSHSLLQDRAGNAGVAATKESFTVSNSKPTITTP